MENSSNNKTEGHKIVLGTVQFGMDYGINNKNGKPDFNEVCRLLDVAAKNEIKILDTAEAYGNSIDVIAAYFKKSQNRFQIISKFCVTENFDIISNLNNTISRLEIDHLYAYMFHRFSDYETNPQLIDQLLKLKERGKILNTGVSVYSHEQMDVVINDESIDLIQFPYNLLDNDNKRGDLIIKAKDKGKILHARSVLLQGLFYKKPTELPTKLKNLIKYLDQLQYLSVKYNIEIGELAYQYVFTREELDGVVIGVDNTYQLELNLKNVKQKLSNQVKKFINQINVKEEELLNPSNWI